MKHLLRLILVSFLGLAFLFPAHAQAEKNITVFMDGLAVPFDVNPTVMNGRTLVPFRALAENLNVAVTWDANTRTIAATDSQTSISLQIGTPIALRNGSTVSLDMSPLIINGRTLVPLRFFSEAFGCQVVWDETAHSIKITSPPRTMTTVGFYALGDQETSSWTNLFGQTFPESAKGNTDVIKSLALGWYSLDQEGNLLTTSRTGWQRPDDYQKVLEAAGKYQLKTEMVIHLTDGDNTITNLLSDEGAMQQAIEMITEEAGIYQGVNLDFEGLGWQDSAEELIHTRESFSYFANQLVDRLHAKNLKLTLTLHAPNSAYQGYDYQKLGQIADKIIVMAYDYGSKPEPASRVIEAVEAAVQAVPAEKLLLGISVPNETPDSIITKVGIAKRYGLNGIALWRLGLVSNEMWNSLRATVQAI
ncbi:stalk domain-containing protein [Desulforamulus ruminis]|uniref:Copper amine oxidase-like domain-containing protein n=1 Tax=Desulforamulus ruminis (strain ATCC 23193 / DSM 2154 / NCIMB 8452 / DL) TaxID=696281 RepID=F6DVH6_DESRL|nr:stalk domain-containing protein [Desulforamulus ruminis]AEG61436.1 copper amine oxidase-like domain-containing protein [Desulforamulus ruminis DSM 2154]